MQSFRKLISLPKNGSCVKSFSVPWLHPGLIHSIKVNVILILVIVNCFKKEYFNIEKKLDFHYNMPPTLRYFVLITAIECSIH